MKLTDRQQGTAKGRDERTLHMISTDLCRLRELLMHRFLLKDHRDWGSCYIGRWRGKLIIGRVEERMRRTVRPMRSIVDIGQIIARE